MRYHGGNVAEEFAGRRFIVGDSGDGFGECELVEEVKGDGGYRGYE